MKRARRAPKRVERKRNRAHVKGDHSFVSLPRILLPLQYFDDLLRQPGVGSSRTLGDFLSIPFDSALASPTLSSSSASPAPSSPSPLFSSASSPPLSPRSPSSPHAPPLVQSPPAPKPLFATSPPVCSPMFGCYRSFFFFIFRFQRSRLDFMSFCQTRFGSFGLVLAESTTNNCATRGSCCSVLLFRLWQRMQTPLGTFPSLYPALSRILISPSSTPANSSLSFIIVLSVIGTSDQVLFRLRTKSGDCF